MILYALLAGLLALPVLQDAHHADCSVPAGGTLLDARFVDTDDDGREELVLAVRTERGERALRIHALDADGMLEPEPRHEVRVLRDVVAWCVCDVRAERGPELVFLTPSGAHAMSLTKRGLRDNLARWIEEPLLLRVPDERALAYWPWTLERPGGDRLLLPGEDGLVIAGSDADGSGRVLQRLAAPDESDPTVEDGNELEISGGAVRLRFEDATREGFLLEATDAPSPVFLASSRGYLAPALADVDGDGLRDVLWLELEALFVLGSRGGDAKEARRIELPDYLKKADPPFDLELCDLDGDGDADLLGRTQAESDETFGNGDHTVLVLLNDGARLLPETPTQVLRFSAAQLRLHVADVDADGTPDLFTRSVSLPSMTALVSGFRIDLVSELHLGRPGRGFERKPAFEETRTYDEDSVAAAIALRDLSVDCSGDGVADLVAVDVSGRIGIRRLRRESSFFGGTSWALEEEPWKRFETRGSILSLDVADHNGDGIGDVLSFGEERLALFLSRRAGGGR